MITTSDTVFSDLTTKCDTQAKTIDTLSNQLNNAKSDGTYWKQQYDQQVKQRTEDSEATRRSFAEASKRAEDTIRKVEAAAVKLHDDTIIACKLELERVRTDTMQACFDRLLDKLA